MKVYQVPPAAAVIFFCLFCLAALSVFVALPIACIQWVWNNIFAAWPIAPAIGVWQAGLLYLAAATVLHLLGVVRIELETRGIDQR
jgi:hypothetical protein